MKRALMIFLLCGMVLGIAGCGDQQQNDPVSQSEEEPSVASTEKESESIGQDTEISDYEENSAGNSDETFERREMYEVGDGSLFLVANASEEEVTITAYCEVTSGEEAAMMFIMLYTAFEELGDSIDGHSIFIYLDDLSMNYVWEPETRMIFSENTDGSMADGFPDWMDVDEDNIPEDEFTDYATQILAALHDFGINGSEYRYGEDAGGEDDIVIRREYEVDGQPLSLSLSLIDHEIQMAATGSAKDTDRGNVLFLTIYGNFKDLEDLDTYFITVNVDDLYVRKQ